jgi:two-component system invasion response regulator UvrY
MISIGLVDDHQMVRKGLHQLISSQEDMTVVGEAKNTNEALDLVRRRSVDVLILDVGLPQRTGDEALNYILKRAPKTSVLIYSGFPEEHYALNLLRRGADAYLRKDGDPEDLLVAIRSLASGKRYITPTVAALLADNLQKSDQSQPHKLLTTKQFQVFLKLAQGVKTADIADSLALSEKQIAAYKRQIMSKMQFHTSSELTYYAMKHGILG